jgi:NIMA (never in mitosis gene a)-related kinase
MAATLSDFQIIKKLGDGAYSSVYKVRRAEDQSVYALKKVKMLKTI